MTVRRRGIPAHLHDEPLAPPDRRSVLVEALAARELPRLVLHAPELARTQRGTGQPVLVLPGHGSSDTATAPLRWFLRRIGHDVAGWGIGSNHGDVEVLLPQVERAAERVVDRRGRPVALVGWSLGGVLAREVARDRPDLVSQVITYGTPVVGGPSYTLGAASYDPDQIALIVERMQQRDQVLIQVPVTAFYSQRDQVVAWRACIDTLTPDVEHIEVRSTHVGLGIDPDVWRGVAERLAR